MQPVVSNWSLMLRKSWFCMIRLHGEIFHRNVLLTTVHCIWKYIMHCVDILCVYREYLSNDHTHPRGLNIIIWVTGRKLPRSHNAMFRQSILRDALVWEDLKGSEIDTHWCSINALTWKLDDQEYILRFTLSKTTLKNTISSVYFSGKRNT